MSDSVQIIAGELRLALLWGEAELSEAVAWADAQILQSDVPDDALTEISLAHSVAAAMQHLGVLAKGLGIDQTGPRLLRRLARYQTMTPEKASGLAKQLYFLATEDDAPRFLSAFTSHWDIIDLAIDGTYGDLRTCVSAFLQDIRTAAAEAS